MNTVALVGNITRDPEYGTTQSGVSYCRFSVACQRRFKNQNGQYEADFINCVAWRQTADFVHKYFLKGNRIGVTGSIQTRSYTAQDGSKRTSVEVLVENVEFVAPRAQDGQQGAQSASQNEGTDWQEVDSDELPF